MTHPRTCGDWGRTEAVQLEITHQQVTALPPRFEGLKRSLAGVDDLG